MKLPNQLLTIDPKMLSVKMDKETGAFWLVAKSKFNVPMRVKDITQDVILCFAAEVVMVPGTRKMEREVRFNDGHVMKITVEDLSVEEQHDLSEVQDGLSSQDDIVPPV